jgi:hypothetical protein
MGELETIPADLIVKAGLLAASQMLVNKPETSCCADQKAPSPSQQCCPIQDRQSGGFMGKNRVVTITESEFIRMKSAIMDKDAADALKLLKEFIKRLEQQENLGLKSHLS